MEEYQVEEHYKQEIKDISEKLNYLTYDEKVEFISDIMCNEWYLIEHYEFLKAVLDIFAKSLK